MTALLVSVESLLVSLEKGAKTGVESVPRLHSLLDEKDCTLLWVFTICYEVKYVMTLNEPCFYT